MVSLGNSTDQIQRTRINPVVIWEFTVSDVAEESLVPIQQFHDARFGGYETFLWIDKAGTTHTVRFANDTQEITEVVGINEYGNVAVLGYSTKVTLKKVWT